MFPISYSLSFFLRRVKAFLMSTRDAWLKFSLLVSNYQLIAWLMLILTVIKIFIIILFFAWFSFLTGIEIMSVYRFGSRVVEEVFFFSYANFQLTFQAQSDENHRLAVPKMKWLGILPSDFKKF